MWFTSSHTAAHRVKNNSLALGIIIAVLLPLSRIMPPLYEFRVRSRVFRWYGQLRDMKTVPAAALKQHPV